jgi:hypothetical protein
MNEQHSDRTDLNHNITRRRFIGPTAGGSAALLTGGLTSLLRQSASAVGGFDFIEATIPQLQAAMASGELTSKRLVMGYLDRIQSLNPLLHSVIETNPNAISIAQHLDNKRRGGHVRGPLHGIPILVKDNIRDRRQYADDGWFICIGQQPCASRRGDHSAAARSRRSDSWQSESWRMGKLPWQ